MFVPNKSDKSVFNEYHKDKQRRIYGNNHVSDKKKESKLTTSDNLLKIVVVSYKRGVHVHIG